MIQKCVYHLSKGMNRRNILQLWLLLVLGGVQIGRGFMRKYGGKVCITGDGIEGCVISSN